MEESVQDGAVAVGTDITVELTLKQKAEVLRDNDVDIVQVSDYNRLPTIFFAGNTKEGPRVFDIAVQQGWDGQRFLQLPVDSQ